MLITLGYLVDRLWQPPSRAHELYALRRRLSSQSGPAAASAEERLIAQRLSRLKTALADLFGSVESCKGCVRPRSPRFPGGHCCSGRTEHLFTDDELGALKLAGTTVTSLRLPRADHVGCAFRGPAGCSLAPAHRPCLCVRYTCRELESELALRPDHRDTRQLREELRAEFERFVACRRARRQKDSLAGQPSLA
jgi:hypothetical protein